MNFFKLLVIFILLLLGSFAQRFQRHSINGIKNDNKEMESLDALLSDGQNYEQYGGDVKFVRDGGEVNLQLVTKELKFKFCSDGCMDKVVTVCYDANNPDGSLKGSCASNQCEFKAGVSSEFGTTFLWFASRRYDRTLIGSQDICEDATMKSPKADVTYLTPEQVFTSCEPLISHEKVIKLTVTGAKHNCPIFVANAKKWTPPTTTTQNSSGTTLPNQTTSKSSEANTTLWIGIGAGIFIVLIVVIGFGYCFYRTQIQKKPLFGKKKEVEKRVIIPEASKKAKAAAENEKTEDEKEVLQTEKVVAKPQPTKEAIVAKEKPAKKKAPKEKKAPIVVPKPSKEITQEDNPAPAKKVSVEPTLEPPTTEASVVQKSIVQKKHPKPGDPPRVYVPNKVILPAPKSVNAPKSGSLSGKKDSLSGRHEIGMQSLVQSSPECVKRLNFGNLNAETKEKLEKFYPPGSVRSFDRREIELLCCSRISVMFKIIEALVDNAMKALAEHGVTFDEKSIIIEMTPEAEKYLRSKSTPEYVRSFAFGSVFRKFIDSHSNIYENFSIPLLFSIVLQRRYTVVNRRQACTWIRRELPIIQKEFAPKERSKLAYPICAIEAACKMNEDGFKNVFLLNTLSGDDEDDETQNSTRASEKLGKNSYAGTKKNS